MKPSLLLLLISVLPVAAQGPLVPPAAADPATAGPLPARGPDGRPQPVMKSMHQIEPRTPIPLRASSNLVSVSENGNVTIHATGSYYLTGDLVVPSGNAITVEAPDVTIDLNGFRISTTASPAAGIGINCTKDGVLTVRNGRILGEGTINAENRTFSGSGFATAIFATSSQLSATRLQVSGALNGGILGSKDRASVVESCTVQHCGGTGIQAGTVRSCVVMHVVGAGIDAEVVSSSSGASLGSDGIRAVTVTGCIGTTSALPNQEVSGISGTVVSHSKGVTSGGGVTKAITAAAATSCLAVGPVKATNTYNMP